MAGVKGRGGQKGRSGRKPKHVELGLPALLDKCWTVAQREECIRGLAEQAKAGNMEAIKLLMAYTYGKPTERHQHSGENGAPIQIEVIYADRN